MRAIGISRRDALRAQYDAVVAPLCLPLPQGVPADQNLRLLFRPRGEESGAISASVDARNMAPGLSALTAPRFCRRINNSGTPKPSIARDNYGPYWDFTSTSQRFTLDSGGNPNVVPWPTAAGHTPATIAAVFRLTAATTAEQYLFFIGGGTATTCGIGIGFSSGSVVTGKIFTRTTRTISTTAITLNQPYAAIFTSRTTTDHEVVCRNLVTGAVLSNASALDSGSATGQANGITFGSQVNLVSFLDRARIYAGAFWDRAFSSADMLAWVAAPMALMCPRTPGLRFGEQDAPPRDGVAAFGPGIAGLGGWGIGSHP